MADFDPFKDGGAVEVGEHPTFDPFSAGAADATGTASGAPQPPSTMGDAPGGWKGLYSGVDNLPNVLQPEQRAMIDQLDKNNPQDVVEARSRAVNQAFVQSQLKDMPAEAIQRNWPAVRDAYAKEKLGSPGTITDSAFYSAMSQKLNPETEGEMGTLKPFTYKEAMDDSAYSAKKSLGDFWESINKPLIALPEAPHDLPNVPWLGQFNPAIVGGVYNALKPLVEGVESPLGVATAGAGTELQAAAKEYPLAKAALGSMSGVFAGLMGWQTAKSIQHAPEVYKDPNSTLEDKITATVGPVATGAATLLGTLGAALELMPGGHAGPGEPPVLPEQQGPKAPAGQPEQAAPTPEPGSAQELVAKLANKTPEQAAVILRETAANTDIPHHADFLMDAAHELDEIAAAKTPEEIQEEAAKEVPGGPTTTEPEESAQEGEAEPEKGDSEPTKEPPVLSARVGSITNADIDAELTKMGLEPGPHGDPTSEADVLANAKKAVEDNPTAGADLVNELEKNPRPVTSDEVGLLALEENKRAIARDTAQQAVTDAENGNGDLGAAVQQAARARDAYEQAARVFDQVGTKNAQGLALRRIRINQDESLASVERKYKAANGGKDLPAKATKQIADLTSQLADAKRRLDEQMVREDKEKTSPTREAPRRPKPPSKVAKYISDQAEAARNRIKERMESGKVSSGLDPTDLADHAIVGAEYLAKGVTKFAEWSTAMVNELGERIKPFLHEIFDKANDVRDRADGEALLSAKRDKLTASIEEYQRKIDEGDLSTKDKGANRPEAVTEIEKLSQQRDGLRDELNQMREHAGKVKDLQDAIAEKQRKIDENDLSTKGKPVNRPSVDEIEQLKQKRDGLNEKLAGARKEANKPTADEVTKAKVDQINKQIAELDKKLKDGDLSTKGRVQNRPQPEEIEKVRQELDGLRKQMADARKAAAEPSREDLIKRKVEQIEKQIAKQTEKVRTGDIEPQGKPLNQPEPKEIQDAKDRLAEVNAKLAEMRKPVPKTKEELQTNRANKTIKGLKERIAANDFGPRTPKPAVELSPAVKALRAEIGGLRRKIQLGEMDLEAKNLSSPQKARHFLEKWVRTGVLSYPTVGLKLAAAAASRIVVTPAEQLLGYMATKLLPDAITEKARFEAVPTIGGAVRAESKAFVRMVTKGIEGSKDLLLNRETELTKELDKEQAPPALIEYLGKLHQALKNPVKEADFARRLQLVTEAKIREGVDMTIPTNQIEAAHEAFEYSKRSVFMQDNGLVNAYKRGLAALEGKQKETGKPSMLLQALSTGLKTALPIVKVPANFAAELTDFVAGLPVAGVKTILHAANGFDGLTYGEADQIMRQFKKGSIGAAMTLYGYYNYKQFGGVYQPDQKPKKGDVGEEGIKIGGTKLPRQLSDSPAVMSAQIGATIARVGKSLTRKQAAQFGPVARGTFAALVGLTEKVPFFEEMTQLDKLTHLKSAMSAADAKGASLLIPGVVSWTAAQMDKKDAFSPTEDSTPRQTNSFGDALKKDTPGLRSTLPKQKAK